VALTQQDVPVCQSPVQQFQPANDIKKILLDESEPTKFIVIGAGQVHRHWHWPFC
jgi:hypothetical protein